MSTTAGRASNGQIEAQLDLPESISVVTCSVSEGISQQTHAALEIASTEDLDLSEVLESPAILRLVIDGAESRSWTLRVGDIDFIGLTDGSMRYLVHLYPAMWLLRYTTNTRKFRKQSAKDIISTILGEHGLSFSWQLTREPEQRNYCVQYRESNLDFVCRLLEFEGIYYTFAADGTVVLADTSPGSPQVAGDRELELIEAAGAMQWDRLGLFELSKGAKVCSGAATVNDFNWKTPQLNLLATVAADMDAELEVYDYPTGYRRPDQGQRLAQLRLEALRVPARFVEGAGNVHHFAPAHIFTFGGASAGRFEGGYLLVRVEHDFQDRRFDDSLEGVRDGVNYRNRFHAIDQSVVFRPPLLTAHPHVAGCHTAMVRGPSGEEIHTDEHGRFRAQFHWDREGTGTDEASRWLRNLQETASSMALARVGWEMSVAYIDGDPDRPLGFARNINGVMKSEYGQPDNKTRMTVKTPSYPSAGGGFNELRLEDSSDKQHFDWKAEKDLIIDVKNDRSEHVGVDETHKVGQTMTHQVEHDQQVKIGNDLKVKIGADSRYGVNGNRTKSVGGNETIEVGGTLNASTQCDETEEVGGNRQTKAGEDEGAITRQVEESMKRSVAGASITTGEGNIATVVQKEMIEKVGGAKLIHAKTGQIGGSVTGQLKVNVGSTVMRVAEKGMGYSAKQTSINVSGAAAFDSGEKITINGNHIQLQADSSLKLVSGALEIALSPGQTAIKGKMKLDSADSITITGNPDNLTK